MAALSLQAQRQYFEKNTYTQDDYTLPYRFSIPENYNPDDTTKYPIILFFHGAGERGNDNEAQLTYVDKVFGSDEFRKKYPAFILAPQCPNEKKWVEVDWSLKSHTIPDEMSVSMKLTMTLLLKTIHSYNIDTQRIYVTGLSMGGYGTWDIIARFPTLFAAAAPLCGGGDENTAPEIAQIPIWAFHGTLDKAVPVERSRNMVEAISDAGGTPKYTEYSTKGHFIWETVYANDNLWEWMFSQKNTTKK